VRGVLSNFFSEEELEAKLFVAQKRLRGKQYQAAAKKKETSKLKSSKSLENFPAKLTPSGTKPEVIIQKLRPKMKKVVLDSDEEAAAPASRPKRNPTKVIVVDSDDDAAGEEGSDYEQNEVEQERDDDDNDDDEQLDDESDGAKKPKDSGSKAKPTPPPSSRSATSDEEVEILSSEDEKPKKKSTAKASGVKKGNKSTKFSSDDDSMDVDDPPSPTSASSTKKRKATCASDGPAKKQKRREDTDPWHLESAGVKRDWTQMRSPPLEVFHFARVVVDEYTYLGGKVHSMVTKLTADRRWVLSGTPPIHDFGSVKTIAAHLNIHLGIDDGGEGQSAMIKKRIREQTSMFD